MKPIRVNVKSLPGGTGIMLFPFAIISKEAKDPEKVYNHEAIHFQQALEIGVIPFYLWIGIEYLLYGFFKGPAETEAYGNDQDLDYLKKRKRWAWIK